MEKTVAPQPIEYMIVNPITSPNAEVQVITGSAVTPMAIDQQGLSREQSVVRFMNKLGNEGWEIINPPPDIGNISFFQNKFLFKRAK